MVANLLIGSNLRNETDIRNAPEMANRLNSIS